MGVKLALAAAVVTLAVAACSGDDPSPTTVPTQPPPSSTQPSTSAPPTTTPAPTPSATPPPLPATARQDTPTGAESFARYYISTLDYAYQSGDTRTLRKLADCKGCNAVADGIEKWISSGGIYEGGRLAVISSRVVKHVPGRAGLVSITYSRSDRVLVSATGQREEVDGSPSLDVLATELKTSSGWLITNIQTVK